MARSSQRQPLPRFLFNPPRAFGRDSLLGARRLHFESLESRVVLSAATGTYADLYEAESVDISGSTVDATFASGSVGAVPVVLEDVSNTIVTPRGRPTLNESRTTFVADNGRLLRGPFTSTEWTPAVPYSEIEAVKDLGFNAVHLYAEVFDTNYVSGVPGSGRAPGYAVAEVDKIVDSTRDLGLYLVMTIGNGANNGNYNEDYVLDFWDLYADRYKDETHVLFEIQNEPVAWSPPYSSPSANPPGALDMEIAAYNVIRSHAPETPVLLFSYAVLGGNGGSAALTDIELFNAAVFGNSSHAWTNEAVAIHGYGGYASTVAAAEYLIAAGYPLVMTEYGTDDWGGAAHGVGQELTHELERLNVSWLTFQHIPPTGVAPDVTDPHAYKDLIELAGISWTPDFGTWPVARGPYGNGGQPRETTGLSGTLRIQAEDFDLGGEGVAYHDADAANSGGQYRTDEGVDIEITSDAGGGFHIAGTSSGEWLEYTVWVQEPGFYDLRLRYASAAVGSVQVDSYGEDRTGTWTLPASGGSETWTTATKQVFLEFGLQRLRLNVLEATPRLNWIELSPVSSGTLPNGAYKIINRNSGMAAEADTVANLLAQDAYSGASVQRWNLVHRGAGQYSIGSAASSSRYWSTFYNGDGDSVNLNYWGFDGSADRRFIVRPQSDGYYSILVVDGGRAVEVDSASLASGADIQQLQYFGGVHQQWAVLAPSAPQFPTQLVAAWGDVGQLPGDYNVDGLATGADFLAWQRSLGAPVPPRSGADGDGSGVIDAGDLTVWTRSFGHATGSPWVQLSWEPTPGADGYNVKRAPAGGGPYATIAQGVTGTAYSDTGLTAGAGYRYVVSAIGAGGESLDSNEAAVVATLAPLADTYARDGWGDGVHGSEPILAVKNDGGVATGFNRNTFLKFDVSGLENAERVTLKLTPYQVDGNATLAYEFVANDSWSEAGTTWNNQPAGTGIVIASVSGYIVGQPVEIDVTEVARGEAAGDGILSLKVSQPSPAGIFVGFHSRESETSGLGPVLEYQLGVTTQQTIFQAETATLSGVDVATFNAGYFGTGYADFVTSADSYIEWDIPVAEAGFYDLAFRYALGAAASRPLELRINGAVVNPAVDFAPTGGWTNWQDLVISAQLAAGTNTIRITSIGSSGGNFDQIAVTPTNSPTPLAPDLSRFAPAVAELVAGEDQDEAVEPWLADLANDLAEIWR